MNSGYMPAGDVIALGAKQRRPSPRPIESSSLLRQAME